MFGVSLECVILPALLLNNLQLVLLSLVFAITHQSRLSLPLFESLRLGLETRRRRRTSFQTASRP